MSFGVYIHIPGSLGYDRRMVCCSCNRDFNGCCFVILDK